ncbi:MAG: hypothetical protein ACRDJV_10200 [Actinomycetota bacterium]
MKRHAMNRRSFWLVALPGWAVMGFGVWSLWHDASRTHPGEWIKWFAGAALVHDFIAAPIVFGAAFVLVRTLPARMRPIVQSALVATGVFVLITFPFLRGYGRNPANPSVLPNNYARNLLIVLAIVWGWTGIAILCARTRPQR